jgi:hypothetical protein
MSSCFPFAYVPQNTPLHLVRRLRVVELTSTSPYVFIAWCLIKSRDNFTVTLISSDSPSLLLGIVMKDEMGGVYSTYGDARNARKIVIGRSWYNGPVKKSDSDERIRLKWMLKLECGLDSFGSASEGHLLFVDWVGRSRSPVLPSAPLRRTVSHGLIAFSWKTMKSAHDYIQITCSCKFLSVPTSEVAHSLPGTGFIHLVTLFESVLSDKRLEHQADCSSAFSAVSLPPLPLHAFIAFRLDLLPMSAWCRPNSMLSAWRFSSCELYDRPHWPCT